MLDKKNKIILGLILINGFVALPLIASGATTTSSTCVTTLAPLDCALGYYSSQVGTTQTCVTKCPAGTVASTSGYQCIPSTNQPGGICADSSLTFVGTDLNHPCQKVKASAKTDTTSVTTLDSLTIGTQEYTNFQALLTKEMQAIDSYKQSHSGQAPTGFIDVSITGSNNTTSTLTAAEWNAYVSGGGKICTGDDILCGINCRLSCMGSEVFAGTPCTHVGAVGLTTSSSVYNWDGVTCNNVVYAQ
jgi:hypothetical protein